MKSFPFFYIFPYIQSHSSVCVTSMESVCAPTNTASYSCFILIKSLQFNVITTLFYLKLLPHIQFDALPLNTAIMPTFHHSGLSCNLNIP